MVQASWPLIQSRRPAPAEEFGNGLFAASQTPHPLDRFTLHSVHLYIWRCEYRLPISRTEYYFLSTTG